MPETTERTILCIVDDPKVAVRIGQELGRHGFKVVPAHSAQAAMAAATRERPDLVLVDVDMPDMSGFDIRARIAAMARRFRNLPFIFIAEDRYADGKLSAHALDGEDYVVKPFSLDVLRATISIRLTRMKRPHRGSESQELSQRELEVLTWSARGRTSAEIAQMLGLSKRTVDSRLDSAKVKLGAATRIEAAVTATTRQLIKP